MSTTAMKQALEALKYMNVTAEHRVDNRIPESAITSLSQAIAEAEKQEPAIWWNGGTQFASQKAKDWDKRTGGTTAFGCDIPLYTTPQPAQKPLTDEQIEAVAKNFYPRSYGLADFARAIEAAHGIKE